MKARTPNTKKKTNNHFICSNISYGVVSGVNILIISPITIAIAGINAPPTRHPMNPKNNMTFSNKEM